MSNSLYYFENDSLFLYTSWCYVLNGSYVIEDTILKLRYADGNDNVDYLIKYLDDDSLVINRLIGNRDFIYQKARFEQEDSDTLFKIVGTPVSIGI